MMHFLASLAFASTAFGHLIMDSPIPFGKDTLNNSPLVDAKPGTAQSDYPCKKRQGVYDISAMNHMAVGDPQELNFTGSASHGGGTCQIAVTMDAEPDVSSVWKLIQVFEGGCPIDADGNSGTHPFTFTIPKDFPNGRASLAWVWYNRIGNRELYMNCAPITVTGGSDSKDYYDTLPNMYVINLPTSECSSQESVNQLIPEPGQFIMKEDAQSVKAATGPKCAASAAAQTSGVKAYQSATSSDGAAYQAPATNGDSVGAPPATSAAAPSTSAAAATTSAAMSQAPASTPVSSVAFPTLTPSSDAGVGGGMGPTATAPASPAGTGSSSGSGSSSGGSCSGDNLICDPSDGKKFGLCDNGSVVWQPVAPGTECTNGAIAKAKRDVPHARQHMRMGARRRHAAAAALGGVGKAAPVAW